MAPRFPLPDLARLDDDQQAVVASILSRRPSIDGPFLPWLHRPGLASAAERLGAYLRYDTGLSVVESEFAILCVAAKTRSDGEKRIHGPIAIKAGLPDAVVAQLVGGVIPAPEEPRLAAIAVVCRELTTQFRLSDAACEQASKVFDTGTVVELVALVGYYTLAAMTLNVFMPSGSAQGS